LPPILPYLNQAQETMLRLFEELSARPDAYGQNGGPEITGTLGDGDAKVVLRRGPYLVRELGDRVPPGRFRKVASQTYYEAWFKTGWHPQGILARSVSEDNVCPR
jgi:hypothetical protein